MSAGTINRACVGCKGISTNGTFRCDECQKKAAHVERAEESRYRKLYHCKAWFNLRDAIISCGNSFCQRVHDGVRCRNVGVILHHIIGAETALPMGLFYEARLLVMCCRSCHPRPWDSDQGEFIPTLWISPLSDEKVGDALAQPGFRVADTSKLWTRSNRLKWARNREV
jgi:hypothetical protein